MTTSPIGVNNPATTSNFLRQDQPENTPNNTGVPTPFTPGGVLPSVPLESKGHTVAGKAADTADKYRKEHGETTAKMDPDVAKKLEKLEKAKQEELNKEKEAEKKK